MGSLVSRLKIHHVAFVAIFLCFVLVNADKIHDPDMWWHLKVGQYIFENGSVPKTDFFSFSNNGHPWIAHEWGSELLYYMSYKLWQFRGLFTVNILFLSAAYFILGRLIHLRTDKDLTVTTVVLVICTVFSSLFWVFRPHLLAYLFFIVYIYILELYIRGKNFLWILPVLMVFWVNMHGSFIMGVVLICIYLFSGLFAVNRQRLVSPNWNKTQLKQLTVILGLVITAIMINPNTVKMYYYPFFTMNSKAITDNIKEWSSPNFHELIFKAFLAYMFMVYTVLIISKKRIRLPDIIMLGLFTYLAMFGARNIALFMFVTGPVLGAHLAGFLPRERPQRQLPAVNWLVLLAVVIYGIMSFPPQMTIDEKVDKDRFPYDAVQYMKSHNLRGSLFNDYTWGGYLLWTRYPDNPVFIDGRADIYEDKVLPEYMRIIKLKPDAYQLLQKYNPEYILIPPAAPINHLIKDKGDWQEVYRDKVAVLYARGS